MSREKICGALGCTNEATVQVDHERLGAIYVCDSHAEGQTTLQEVPA